MFYKKFIEIMSKGGYRYNLEKTCDYCMYDPSDGKEYYENCLDCGLVQALLMFSNGTHQVQFEGYFGTNFSSATFFEGTLHGWVYDLVHTYRPFPFSINDIVYIAFLDSNLIGFKLKTNKKIEIKDGKFFREI